MSAPRTRLLLAFAAVYVIWGSTYLAIRYAVVTIPPFLMVGTRFLVSGAILFGFSRARGAAPSTREWRDAGITGLLLLCGGNAAVAWAEQRVPSGPTALLVAVVPVWMVVLDWLRPGGHRPRAAVFAGLALGLAGIALLVGPGQMAAMGKFDGTGVIVLVLGSLSWAAGSIYNREGARPASAQMATGMQMLVGSAALLALSAATGEWSGFHVSQVSGASFAGWLYLVTFGAIVGFTAYIYLLRETTPARASTYAYINPVVAVFLGWSIAGETVSSRVVLAAAVILGGVAIVTRSGGEQAVGQEG